MASTVRTRFQVADDPQRLAAGLTPRELIYLLNYRASVHPYAGARLTEEASVAVNNALQGIVAKFAMRRDRRALKVGEWTFLVAEPASEVIRDTGFLQLTGRLLKPLVTPTSNGWSRGAHFWGSVSVSTTSGLELSKALQNSTVLELLAGLGEAGKAVFRESSFYTSPGVASVSLSEVESVLGQPGQGLTTGGAYEGSVRSRLGASAFSAVDSTAEPSTRQLALGSWGSTGRVPWSPGLDGIASVDDWGPWTEIVPHCWDQVEVGKDLTPHTADDKVPNSGTDGQIDLASLQRALEPLIRDLWLLTQTSDGRSGEIAELHSALVGLSESSRSGQRSLILKSLGMVAGVLLNVAAGVVASSIYTEHARTIHSLIDRYLLGG